MITKSQKKQILESCHSSGPDALNHFDQDRTLAEVSRSYYWPKMDADVKMFCQSCEQCKGDSRYLTVCCFTFVAATKNLHDYVHSDCALVDAGTTLYQ